jgi:hypothetical protein
MIKRMLLLSLFVIIVAKPTFAQSPNEVWFWAWRSYDLKVEHVEDQRGELLAFTPTRTVNVLLKNVFPVVLQRIDDDQAFVLGKIDNTYSLYYLTSTQAITVMELFDQSYVDELRNYVLYDGYRYFAPEIIPAGESRYLIADKKRKQYTIFDVEKNSTMSVNLRAWCNEECVRVSIDGRYIRYRVSPSDPRGMLPSFYDRDENALPYQIFEYDIEAQTERLIYEQKAIDRQATPPIADCTPDQYGGRWYCELYLDDSHSPGWIADEKQIVSVDGTIETVPSVWRLELLNRRWYFLDLDRIPENNQPCLDCPVRVHPDRLESPSFQFIESQLGHTSLQNGYLAFGSNFRLLSEQHIGLGLRQGGPFYAVSREGEVTEMGVRHCCADPISQDYYDESKGYLVTYNRSVKQTQIWNTRSLELIGGFSGDIVPGVRSTFRDYSLVLFKDLGSTPSVVYSYTDTALYEFNFTKAFGYIDAFSGGVLLVDYGDRDLLNPNYAATNDAIYLWTPSEGETLLIDGAVPILVR